jgi:hypothetical protein
MRAVRKNGAISQIGYLGKQDIEAFLPLLIDKAIRLRYVTSLRILMSIYKA